MKYLLALFPLLLPLSALAEENMQFHGALVAPPCTISNGKTIEVPFGDNLGVNKIDGTNYKKTVPYTVNCDSGYAANNLAIIVDTAAPATFDASAVQTTQEGLGIRILVDGVAATFAKRIVVSDPASPPVIEAVPVQKQSVTLKEGAFSATMTLRTDYL